MRNISSILTIVLFMFSCAPGQGEIMEKEQVSQGSQKDYKGASITELEYQVTRNDATEPPFKNSYWDNKRAGLYVDVYTGKVLFSSLDKFRSGTGWPSFTAPVKTDAVTIVEDSTFGLTRIEVRSKSSDSHLGHVFDDGPQGKPRYCINSAALRFIAFENLQQEGYAEYLKLFGKSSDTLAYALFGGGCFWGVEHLLEDIPGVVDAVSGYAGGSVEKPNYRIVSTGTSGHAEVVKVSFDPGKISYTELLEYFFRLHDPTTVDRQGVDVGSQYRSVIFYYSEEQKKFALELLKRFNRKNRFGKDAVTEISAYKNFYPAEDYHQDYYTNNPGRICHLLADEI